MESSSYISHHGILGMKWGQRNGPPYPLGPSDHSASEKKAGWKKSLSKEEAKRFKKDVRDLHRLNADINFFKYVQNETLRAGESHEGIAGVDDKAAATYYRDRARRIQQYYEWGHQEPIEEMYDDLYNKKIKPVLDKYKDVKLEDVDSYSIRRAKKRMQKYFDLSTKARAEYEKLKKENDQRYGDH